MADDFRWELPVPNPTRHVLRHDLIFENELYPLIDEHIYALNKMATAKTTKIRFLWGQYISNRRIISAG